MKKIAWASALAVFCTASRYTWLVCDTSSICSTILGKASKIWSIGFPKIIGMWKKCCESRGYTKGLVDQGFPPRNPKRWTYRHEAPHSKIDFAILHTLYVWIIHDAWARKTLYGNCPWRRKMTWENCVTSTWFPKIILRWECQFPKQAGIFKILE